VFGTKDNTAANAFWLVCYKSLKEIQSFEMPWGSFGPRVNCPRSDCLLTGFSTKVENLQGAGDDTLLNQVQLACKCSESKKDHVLGPLGITHWGEWGSWVHCEKDQAVNGF
jgi:hypothetical protein